MRTRIFLGTAITLLLVAVMAIGAIGSGAWFTDNATITANDIKTGTLSFSASSAFEFPVDTSNMEPGGGKVTVGYFTVTNTGTLNMKWRGKLDGVVDAGNIGQYLYLTVTLNPTDVVGYDGNYGPAAPSVTVNHVCVNELDDWNDEIVLDDPVWPFKPWDWAGYKVEIEMDKSAPDTAQGQTYSAHLYLEATQYINDSVGW
ncbi:MAG TPA: TasA family protein [Anaerolineae bacterium]|nr:TasA family protein [Anaerolineae bacterium]HOR00513.1 TasA family protein [Anaerolineae bacterium]HPL28595.1 TasA family protein [Anaerolineae bacterium]